MTTRAELLATLPRKRVTAGALIRDPAGRVLLVEPSYRPDRLPPGGSVEADESPRQAAAREVGEELGAPLAVGRLLALLWDREADDPDGVLHLLYDGGVVDDAAVARFRLEPGLLAHRFVEPVALTGSVAATTARLLVAGLEALAGGGVVELP